MIIKSFFRSTSTKIYLILFIILLMSISYLLVASDFLRKSNNEAYYKMSLFYLESNEDIYNRLINNENIINVHETLRCKYYDDIIDYKTIVEDELNNEVLVYADENNEYGLSGNETVIILSNNYYDSFSSQFSNILGKNIEFILNEENILLNIKQIDKAYRSRIIISSELFDKLKDKQTTHICTANFINEDVADKLIPTIAKENEISRELDVETNLEYREKMKKNYKIVHYISNVLIIVFLIITVVINKNIIADLRKNMALEKRLGYTKFQTKLNILKRLVSLHGLSYLVCTLITVISLFIFNIITKLGIEYSYITNTVMLISLILLSDLLLILIVNDKSNINRRRKKL